MNYPRIPLMAQRNRISGTTVSTSQDALGGEVRTYTTAFTSIPCSIHEASGTEVYEYSRRGVKVSHEIVMDNNNKLELGMELTDENGIKYVVSHFSDNAGQAPWSRTFVYFIG